MADLLTSLLADRVAELEERLRILENALVDTVRLPFEWQLTSSEAMVFAVLAGREFASKKAIMAMLYSDRPEEPEPKIVNVFICKLRRKLKPFGVVIETVWGQGYQLADRQKYRAVAA